MTDILPYIYPINFSMNLRFLQRPNVNIFPLHPYIWPHVPFPVLHGSADSAFFRFSTEIKRKQA